MKKSFFILLLIILFNSAFGQKMKFNREILQLNYEGVQLMNKGKKLEALDFFNNAISRDPESFFAFQNRATCYLSMGDTTKAINDFRANVRLEPDNAFSYFSLGSIFKARKDTLEALSNYNKAIKYAKPDFDSAAIRNIYTFCGNYYRIKEKYDSAIVYFSKLIDFDALNYSSHISRAVCYYKLDSIPLFCYDLEKAKKLGGKVPCIILNKLCSNCKDTLLNMNSDDNKTIIVDARLDFILYEVSKTKVPEFSTHSNFTYSEQSRLIRVYFNHYWQICAKEDAQFYRESFWSQALNFFGGNFTDYYITGEKLAEGNILGKKLEGNFIKYYKDGTKMVEGKFAGNIPVNKMIFYQKNGEPDFAVEFIMDDFKIKCENKITPNHPVNSGNGSFSLLLEKIHDVEITLNGKFKETKYDGVWTYKQGEMIIWSDKYNDGKFKGGTINTVIGIRKTESPGITSATFTPPYISQIQNLFFDKDESFDLYNFIRKSPVIFK